MAENKKPIELQIAQQELHLEVNSKRLELDKSTFTKTEKEKLALKVAKAEFKKNLK